MKLKAILGTTVLAVGATLFMGATNGCSDLHKANQATGVIAASLNQAAVTNHTITFESADERTMIANYIAQAASANDIVVGVLADAAKNGGKPDPVALTTAINSLTNRISDLNTLGVLHLKSSDAQADFQLAVSGLQAQLATLKILLASYMASVTVHNPLKHPTHTPLFALALTAEEIEELIALLIAAGSALVPKFIALRGAADTDILVQAAADDAAAIKQAEADGATPPTTT